MATQEEINIQLQNAHLNSLLLPLQVRLKSGGPNEFQLVEVLRMQNDQDGQQEISIPAFNDQKNKRPINILSFYNRARHQIKLAICICAYNENRSMLEKSLLGIYRSLKTFREQANISSDQIVVEVIFDGIQKVCNDENDKQIDVQNGLYHNKHVAKYNDMRFQQKYKEYKQTKKLLDKCKKQNKQFDLDKVDSKIKETYESLRFDHLVKQFGNRVINDQLFLRRQEDNFDSRAEKRKFALQLAYQKVKNNCQKKIKVRDDTSLVYPMRYKPQKAERPEVGKEGQQLHPINNNNNTEDYLNVLLVIKHKNAKKLSSHALFFLGFCTLIKPEICMLLDTGLQPQGNSIYNMYKYMVQNQKTGGACGYMGLKIERAGDEFGKDSKLQKNIDSLSYFLHQNIFDIQKAQRFQYHMGHLVDKPFQSLFNFIHVLPGAFSCYRYQCVQNELALYLSPALNPDDLRTLQEQNINLAEDRILSLGLKAGKKDFAYIPDAYAVVDPMKTLYDLKAQRRRWINGSWFAFHSVIHKRNQIDDCVTQFQLYYYQLMHGITYISIGIYFSTIYITIRSLTLQYCTNDNSRIITSVIGFIYVLMVGSMMFLSLNEKSNDSRFQAIYYLVSTLLGIYGIMVLVLMVINLAQGIIHPNQSVFMNQPGKQQDILIPNIIIVVLMFSTIGIYGLQVLLASFFSGCEYGCKIIFEIIRSVHHFLFYAPTYLHNMMIYAFCKVDDFSWGTKGLDKQDKGASYQTQKNKKQKYYTVFKFLIWNVMVGIVLCLLTQFEKPKQILLVVMAFFFCANSFFKSICSYLYLFKYSCKSRKQMDPQIKGRNKIQADQIRVILQDRLNRQGINLNQDIANNQREYDRNINPQLIPLDQTLNNIYN